jgi:integrase
MTMSELPPHVYAVRDRHGKVRHRFIRKGWKSRYLPGLPGEVEFHRTYATIIEGGAAEPEATKSPTKAKPRSLDDLLAQMRQTVRWRKKCARTQLVQGRLLERFMDRIDNKGRRYGERPVSDVSVGWLEKILGMMWETPAAANVLRKTLSGLLDLAVSMEWRASNPVRFTTCYAEGEGHHDWTDEEIEQYRAKHPLGTMARLTMELALNTAARRCNVNKIERDHIKRGRIEVAHVKGNHETSVPMLATTRAALDALPAAPIKFLVITQYGKPFTDAGLGNRMRKWCDEADLPHCSIHGLRKAMSRQLAEGGASDAEGQAVTGHKKDKTFQHYRAKANRSMLADHAFSNLESEVDFQPTESDGKPDA